MSEEKNTSQLNNKHKSRRHRKNHFSVLPYILTPVIFVLISLIVIVPVSVHMMNIAIDTVHKAQETLSIDFNDIKANNNYSASDSDRPTGVSKFGIITCENAGLNADAYYGMNRVSLRNGAGVSSESSLPGDKGTVNVYGYTSTAFKALKYVETGDVITFETGWGVYRYEVKDVLTSDSAPESNAEQSLILASAENSKAFSSFNDEKLYILAELISADPTGEVQ